MAKVSFSQYSMWSSCPHQYKLNYIDKLGESSSNIHTIFGTAMHETIQHYLSVMYGVSKKQADEINKDKLLLERMREAYKSEAEKMSEGTPCTQIELEEFYGDGRRILAWLDKHMHKFYSKSGFELVGIEIPLNATIKTGVHFIGFIDIVLRDLAENSIIIIDLKTSTMGWNQYQKADKMKNSQILLYKKYYSENIILHSGAIVSITAYKSVPFSSIGWVCITKQTFSAFSLPILSQNFLNATITSAGCFLLM